MNWCQRSALRAGEQQAVDAGYYPERLPKLSPAQRERWHRLAVTFSRVGRDRRGQLLGGQRRDGVDQAALVGLPALVERDEWQWVVFRHVCLMLPASDDVLALEGAVRMIVAEDRDTHFSWLAPYHLMDTTALVFAAR
ncbi:MAG: hypothetical protein ACLQUY_09500 [Ktedonobacterales bacterium]